MAVNFVDSIYRLSSAESRLELALACGVLLLGLVTPAIAQKSGAQKPSLRQQLHDIHSPRSIDEELARLTRDLELTPAQQTQFRTLLQEHHNRIQALLDRNPKASRQDLAPQIHAISDETHREIHALLTDHQKELEKAMQQRERDGEETGAFRPRLAKEYVSPSEAVPRGKAPKMQVQLLNPGDPTKQYAVIFSQGDEAFSGLLEFAEKFQVTSAHFTAIGALSGATLGWFDPQRKMYKTIPVTGQHEVIGMSGDIALYKGKPVVHAHMVVGSPDGTTQGGHVLAAYVSPTLEVMVTVDPVTMQKRFDPATDLTLIDPALK